MVQMYRFGRCWGYFSYRTLRLKICSVVLLPALNNYLFGLRFKLIQHDFQHGFVRVTDEADGSVVLEEL